MKVFMLIVSLKTLVKPGNREKWNYNFPQGHSAEFLIFSPRKKFDLFQFVFMYSLCNKEFIY
jgi:hypothetical protein